MPSLVAASVYALASAFPFLKAFRDFYKLLRIAPSVDETPAGNELPEIHLCNMIFTAAYAVDAGAASVIPYRYLQWSAFALAAAVKALRHIYERCRPDENKENICAAITGGTAAHVGETAFSKGNS